MALLIILLAGCGDKPTGGDALRLGTDCRWPPGSKRAIPPTTRTAHGVLENLEKAFAERDRCLYHALLDPGFRFTEADSSGALRYDWGLDRELEAIGRYDREAGVFGACRQVDFRFAQSVRRTELGQDHPEHPHEDWEVFRGRVEILLLKGPGDGFFVDQVMTFKMRQGKDGYWRIVHWHDEPREATG